jgi:seryl-tRNA synthetase
MEDMELEMKGMLALSAPLADKDALAKFIESSNSSVLVKGAPDGKGAKIVNWNIGADGKTINLEIVSGRFVRPHDALLRFRKAFGAEFGVKHKIGVRDAKIDSYTIKFPLPSEPLHQFQIPFAELSFEGAVCTMKLKEVTEDFLQKNYIDRMINLVSSKAAQQKYEGKGEFWQLMWASPAKEHASAKDPTEEMLAKDWLKQGPTKGKWFFRPQAAAVLKTMERIAIEEVLKPLGFQEIMEPHHDSFETLIKTGHLEGMPQEHYYFFEPKTRDPAAWETFRDYVKITKEVPLDEFMKLVQPSMTAVCYAQCPTIYWSMQGKTIADESLPVTIFDDTAVSNRYESGGRHGIERVDEFHRIEPVYIGTKEQLVELREKLIERYKHVFNEILELEWRMAWVTPFYMQQSGQGGVDDADAKIKGTIDFEAYLPYRGTREQSEWLEFQNLSIVGDKYTKAFNIKGQKSELWSGCSGIGLERWTVAFLAQKGIDPEKWPASFRKYLPEMPKGIKFM